MGEKVCFSSEIVAAAAKDTQLFQNTNDLLDVQEAIGIVYGIVKNDFSDVF